MRERETQRARELVSVRVLAFFVNEEANCIFVTLYTALPQHYNHCRMKRLALISASLQCFSGNPRGRGIHDDAL